MIGIATFRSKRLEALIEGRPQLLVHNGRLFDEVMSKAKLTHHELNAALRQSGCANVSKVQAAILENNGSISVVAKTPAWFEHPPGFRNRLKFVEMTEGPLHTGSTDTQRAMTTGSLGGCAHDDEHVAYPGCTMVVGTRMRTLENLRS